ncbi:MAG: MlaD family protein [Candidatus Gastranaerophilaceae bacterium]
MRFSSSFKVGVLTLAAILILVFTVLWVKGRSLSAGERITVAFKDINGLRAGSGVQMMGVRIGQVESLTPKISSDNSFVELKFVITEPNIKIPTASSISIQQTGIIGEQFLEVTPPELKTIYIPFSNQKSMIHAGDKTEMVLSDKKEDIGLVKKAELVETKSLPNFISKDIKTDKAVKISYVIDMPGLILPEFINGKAVIEGNDTKLLLSPVKNIKIEKPDTKTPYTIIEPMRVSDFMKLQYRSASALAETNEKLSAILSEDVMADIKQTIKNADALTANANVAIDKVSSLVDVSKDEMLILSAEVNDLTSKMNKIADTVISITGDKEFTKTLHTTVKNVNRLSNNVNCLLENEETKALIADIRVTAKNVSEISGYVNDMTKDEELKAQINKSVTKLNTALDKLTITLDTVNYITEDERDNIKQSLKEVEATTANVKTFSEKLNKRFLLFRLMF